MGSLSARGFAVSTCHRSSRTSGSGSDNDNNSLLLLLGTVLSALDILTHLIFTTTYEVDTINYYAQLPHEEIEAKRGQITCPRSHSW